MSPKTTLIALGVAALICAAPTGALADDAANNPNQQPAPDHTSITGGAAKGAAIGGAGGLVTGHPVKGAEAGAAIGGGTRAYKKHKAKKQQKEQEKAQQQEQQSSPQQ